MRRGSHALERALRVSLSTYQRRWGTLPRLQIDARADLGPNARPDAVGLLRERLGLPREGGYDATLTARVRDFQQVHALPVSGLADRATLAALNAGPDPYISKIRLNIERASLLPRTKGRSVLIDAGSARLWMYEGDRVVGTMPVLVGKKEMSTPVLFGLIRYTVSNPYWNVPPDLVRDRIAPVVLKKGPGYMSERRFEALSDWSDNPQVLDPANIDWRRVKAGTLPLRVRQLPGGENMMGAIKFMSPNPLGIYLHDTPAKDLFATGRHYSSGCVRLWDASRLGRWLFNGNLPVVRGNDVRTDLPTPVPVYIGYFTAFPVKDGVRFFPDVYGRDALVMSSGRPGRTERPAATRLAVRRVPRAIAGPSFLPRKDRKVAGISPDAPGGDRGLQT